MLMVKLLFCSCCMSECMRTYCEFLILFIDIIILPNFRYINWQNFVCYQSEGMKCCIKKYKCNWYLLSKWQYGWNKMKKMLKPCTGPCECKGKGESKTHNGGMAAQFEPFYTYSGARRSRRRLLTCLLHWLRFGYMWQSTSECRGDRGISRISEATFCGTLDSAAPLREWPTIDYMN